MKTLPPEARAAIDRILARADLDRATEREVRADLEQHVLDGLEAGRSVDEMVRRLGRPDEVAPLLGRAPAPPRAEGAGLGRGGGDGLAASLVTDLRHALRALRKSPTVALTALVVLALGVGANAVVFTAVNELLLRPLPVRDQETLVDVWADVPGGNSFAGFAWQDVVDYRSSNHVLTELVAFTGRRFTLGTGEGGTGNGGGRLVVGQLVAPAYFSMLGLAPSVGSFPGESAFGEHPSLVLSHALWQEAFGGDPGVLGRTLRVDGHAATVVAVGPEGFRGHFIGFPADVWLPLGAAVPLLEGFDPDDRGRKPFEMIGRLRPGVSPEAAQEDLNAIAARLGAEHPETNRGHRVGVTRTTGVDHGMRAGVLAFAGILTAVAGLVLLIACLNVGSVLLVRAMSREREMAVRLALGAGNGRLVRQLLVESTVLVLVGAGLGLGLAVELNGFLADLVRRLTGGLGLELALDARVLALTVGSALVAAVVAGLAPGLHLLRRDPAQALRARSGGAGAGTRLRAALVVGQVAVSAVLVVATGLFVRSLTAGLAADPGFDAERVATFVVSAPTGPAGATPWRPLLEELRRVPGVEAVSVAGGPVLGVARTPVEVEVPGVAGPPEGGGWPVDHRRVGAGYLDAVGIPLRGGRDLTEADVGEGPRAAVVSQAFVDRFWPGQDPVGRTLGLGGETATVVGVAADVRYLVQDDTPDPFVYAAFGDRPPPVSTVTLRSAAAPASLTAAVRQRVEGALPGHEPVTLRTAREVMDDALFPQRIGALLVGGMGLGALLLAAVGLYGLVQFTVSRDTHELGVRLALGGRRRDLLAVVLRKGFLLVAVGLALGMAVAFLAAPAVETFLVGVGPRDPVTYGTALAVFGGVALLASWLPARRAARIQPTEALRME